MKRMMIEWNGRSVGVWVEKIADTLWFHVEGQTYTWTPERKARSKGGSVAGRLDEGVVKAPMPGKIIQVLAAKDQSVERGDRLVVMEAMKMEYTLEASCAGRVREVLVQVGDQVELGQRLVELDVARVQGEGE